ncbi:hypothetical protein [Lonsdalea quercina]|uniref:hypothetical protein n=1 Tax=Lonsdalea quercina TaxID=71657 RepID=UPI00397656CC
MRDRSIRYLQFHLYDEHSNLLREISPQGPVSAFIYLEYTELTSTSATAESVS